MISVPFHVPSIGPEETAEVATTLQSGWLTAGPVTSRFENDFKRYVEANHALAVNSGTAALHLALAALNIGPGDEVITSPLTFCSTVTSILQVGARPVLADVGPDGNIDPDVIEQRVTERTRAILPVHLAGLPCRMDRIWEIASRFGLRVVEDAAHAVGSRFAGAPIGSSTEPHSDAVAFSFYATKNLTTGEGGMLTTSDAKLADRMKLLCLHGISLDAWNRYSGTGSWRYQVVDRGFKYNFNDILASIGIHQLGKQEEFARARARYSLMYSKAFAALAELQTPPAGANVRHSWHLYILRLNLEKLRIDRDQFIRELHARRVGASVHFIPIPLHPFFQEHAGRIENRCPQAMRLYHRFVSLPLYPALKPEQVDHVIQAVTDIVRRHRRKRSVAAFAFSSRKASS